MPDLSDPQALRGVAKVVRDVLNLGPSYPLENIRVWVQAQQDVGASPAPGRHLKAEPSTKIFVLAYTLVKSPELPPEEELLQKLEEPEFVQDFATQLAEEGVVSSEQLEQLSLGLVSEDKIDGVLEQIQSASDGEDVPLDFLSYGKPVSRRSSHGSCTHKHHVTQDIPGHGSRM